MKKIMILLLFAAGLSYSQQLHSVRLDGNNISSLFWDSGIFNLNRDGSFSAAFEWPKGTGKTANFSSGLSIAAFVNDSLREAMASYRGELVPGYCNNGVLQTDSRFRFYKVSKSDNYINNPDWLNWGLMVPFGAPYVDVNHDGLYNYFMDTPGVKGASQTIFICLTDADPSHHYVVEGFGGGTLPLFAEVHFTAWCYDNTGFEDMQFMKWDIINKNNNPWDSTYFSVYNDFDLGNSDDDYVGNDTIRDLAYCFNGDNDDYGPTWAYGLNPPAVGLAFLGSNDPGAKCLSQIYIGKGGTAICERDPSGEAFPAYYFMRGLKKDRTPWVVPNTNPPQTTKFCFTGDPEDSIGWTERKGSIRNCGGSLTGEYIPINPIGDRRSFTSYGKENLKMHPNDTFSITAVQLIARGTSNLNSVTKLKHLTDRAHEFYQNGFVIGIDPISTGIPRTFNLYQNYPNPFNPVTKIKFDISKSGNTSVKIYDALGREVITLVNEKLNAGTYSVDWDGTNYPSGVYFYRLEVGNIIETKKLILIR